METTKVNLTNQDPEVYKVDLDNPPQPKEEQEQKPNETTENKNNTEGDVGSNENAEPAQEQKEVQPEEQVQEAETPVLEEVVEEEKVQQEVEKVEEVVEQAVAKAETAGKPLPENIQKLVDFIDDTGGSLEDYVRLNTDISKLDTTDVLDEYYRQTKPHLSGEERSFLLD